MTTAVRATSLCLFYAAACSVVFFIGTACALGVADGTESPQPHLPGTYVGRAPANDAAKRTYSLILTADGNALWNTFYLGKAHATLTGHWRQTGAEMVLSFDALGSGLPPRPITFHYHHHELHPIHWDQSEWGALGPPVLERTRDRSAAVKS